MENRVLLKLGGRKHLGEQRWRGALNQFDDIYCTCLYREADCPIESDRVHFYEIPNTWINQRITGLLIRTKNRKDLNIFSWFAIFMLRVFNGNLVQKIKNIHPDKVLCSYGDYDWSDLSCMLFGKVVNMPIVRAYKESRVGYNFLEYNALRIADRIVLYDIELKKFLEQKYGSSLFDGKDVRIGYDENALPSCIINNIYYREKYSVRDGRTHMVILTYRVDSAPNRERDQGRYYYIDVIRKMIKAGIVVHLHCTQYNNSGGINRYEELAKEYPENFYMEKSLEMKHSSSQEEWIHSCEILSQYDVGLLHNIVENSSVSEFDRINIPHRFFAYEAAHVIPVVRKGENCVLERMFEEKKCGYIFDSFEDITEVHNLKFEYYTPTYESYLKSIFDL